MDRRFGVGIVGVKPPDSWAVMAHIPAIRALPGRFQIAGIANTSVASGQRAAEACGIETVFDTAAALCASPDVDIVAITVPAPLHAGLVDMALAAGKHIYCEWPLGPSAEETGRIAAAARRHEGLHICGAQAALHPAIRYVRDLVAAGYIGEPLFATIVANGGSWGEAMPARYAYCAEDANGATLLAVPVGHTLVGLQSILGPVASVFAECSQRRKIIRVIETGESIPLNTPDSAIVGLTFASGLPASLHFRGGINRSAGFRCEIIGTGGELHLDGNPFGAIEMIDLAITAAQAGGAMRPMPVPAEYQSTPSLGIAADNVRRVYELLHNDLDSGSASAPDFDAAERHHALVAAIARSAKEGRRIPMAEWAV